MPQEIPHPIQIKEKNRFVTILHYFASILVIVCALILFYRYVPLLASVIMTIAAIPLILMPGIDRFILKIRELVKDNDCWNPDDSVNYRKMTEKIIDSVKMKTPF